MRGVVVRDDVQVKFLGGLAVDDLKELQPLLMAVLLHARPDEFSFGHIEGSEQGGGAVANIVVGHRVAAALLDGQARLRAVQGLNSNT